MKKGASIRFEFDGEAVKRALLELATTAHQYAARSITEGPKSGRRYYRAGQGRSAGNSQRGRIRHRASAPGEAPASDSGKLLQNLRVENNATESRVGVRREVAYAAALEYGTAKMAARPFLLPAAKKALAGFRMTAAPVIVRMHR